MNVKHFLIAYYKIKDTKSLKKSLNTLFNQKFKDRKDLDLNQSHLTILNLLIMKMN